ncbi:hypothetical protein BSL78_13690 [Apostichopus japonicus]|uniref:Uncharacterized protein n=1 Tax=Stichopus japonicus TaxID=307972 RepID=A0A2G8KN76_STIJA|nr:hypothetical protein BSL78_13690 [Apostichopus japonicus]
MTDAMWSFCADFLQMPIRVSDKIVVTPSLSRDCESDSSSSSSDSEDEAKHILTGLHKTSECSADLETNTLPHDSEDVTSPQVSSRLPLVVLLVMKLVCIFQHSQVTGVRRCFRCKLQASKERTKFRKCNSILRSHNKEYNKIVSVSPIRRSFNLVHDEQHSFQPQNQWYGESDETASSYEKLLDSNSENTRRASCPLVSVVKVTGGTTMGYQRDMMIKKEVYLLGIIQGVGFYLQRSYLEPFRYPRQGFTNGLLRVTSDGSCVSWISILSFYGFLNDTCIHIGYLLRCDMFLSAVFQYVVYLTRLSFQRQFYLISKYIAIHGRDIDSCRQVLGHAIQDFNCFQQYIAIYLVYFTTIMTLGVTTVCVWQYLFKMALCEDHPDSKAQNISLHVNILCWANISISFILVIWSIGSLDVSHVIDQFRRSLITMKTSAKAVEKILEFVESSRVRPRMGVTTTMVSSLISMFVALKIGQEQSVFYFEQMPNCTSHHGGIGYSTTLQP